MIAEQVRADRPERQAPAEWMLNHHEMARAINLGYDLPENSEETRRYRQVMYALARKIAKWLKKKRHYYAVPFDEEYCVRISQREFAEFCREARGESE